MKADENKQVFCPVVLLGTRRGKRNRQLGVSETSEQGFMTSKEHFYLYRPESISYFLLSFYRAGSRRFKKINKKQDCF